MPKTYKLAAVDLDETLLGPDHLVSARNADAVRRLTRAGVRVVIASGRMHASTTRFAQELELPTPILSYNGAMVKYETTGEVIHHIPMNAELAAEIVKWAEDREFPVNYYLNDTLRIKKRTPLSDLYFERTGSEPHEVGDLNQYAGQSPTKLIILGQPEETRVRLHEMKRKYQGRLNVLISMPEYLEFMAPKVSKAYGLEAIGRKYGIAAEEMIAFGDSGNDIAMLEYCGFAVAMGNASDKVKAVCDYVAPRHDEDGFALAVDACIALVE